MTVMDSALDVTDPDRAVMLADPAASPVTRPVALTLATLTALETHVRLGFDTTPPAASRATAVICKVPPIAMLEDADAMVIVVTFGVTVMEAEPLLDASAVDVAVTVADPADAPVTVATVPDPATEATAGLDDDHVTALLAPPETTTLAVRVAAPPTATDAEPGVTVTLVTVACG